MPRPRKSDPPKRDIILDTAWGVFLRQGYSGTSIDHIVAAAGVSKRTVYECFGSKERLFASIVMRRRDQMLGAAAAQHFDEKDPERALRRFAEQHLSMAMSDPVLELYRVVVAEAPRLAEPAKIMFEAGFDRVVALLAEYLERLMKRGYLRTENPRRAAEGFIGLLAGVPSTHGLMKVRTYSRRQLAMQAQFAVAAFLRGMRRRP